MINIKYSFNEMTIQFGDFTERHAIPTTTTTFQDQLDKIKRESATTSSVHPFTFTTECIVFGNFTVHECMEMQELKITTATESSASALHSYSRNYNYIGPPRKRCFRCGYNSHTIESCVALRHKSGEYIGRPGYNNTNTAYSSLQFPSPSSPSSPSSYAGSSFDDSGLSKLTPGDFIFNTSELREWMLHDYEHRLNIYMDEFAQEQQSEDQKMNDYIYLDYLTSNLLFEKQASRYFQHIYK